MLLVRNTYIVLLSVCVLPIGYYHSPTGCLPEQNTGSNFIQDGGIYFNIEMASAREIDTASVAAEADDFGESGSKINSASLLSTIRVNRYSLCLLSKSSYSLYLDRHTQPPDI